MSDYIGRQLKTRNTVTFWARDVYNMARIYKLPHARILELRKEKVYGTPEYRRLNRHNQYFVNGVLDQLAENHWQNLEWRLHYNGEFVSRDKIPDGQWCNVKGGAYFYKDSDRRYTDETGSGIVEEAEV